MNILKLSSYCYPERIASSHLSNDLNEAYEKAGIYCDIYTPTPCRGIDEETRKKYKKIKYEERNNGHIRIHRYGMFKEHKNPLLRAFRYTLCILRGFICGLFAKDIDVYCASSTPPINGLNMFILKLFRKYKIVYNLQDIFPDSMVNAKMTKKGSVIWKIGRVVENITYKSADKIIVISEDFKKNIMEKGVPEDKIEVIYNWVDENKVVNVDRKDNILFDKFGIDRDSFIFGYAGNIGMMQNIDCILNAAKIIEKINDNIKIVIIGDGVLKRKIEERIVNENISNVMLFPMQPPDRISMVYSLADVGIVSLKPGVSKIALPSKSWNIMSAERPVICEVDFDCDLANIIKKESLGSCVLPDDEEAMAEAMLKMYNLDRLELREMGKKCRQYIVENVGREKMVAKYIEVIKNLI